MNVLDLLMAMWQRASQFINVLEHVKKSESFWKQLSQCISQISSLEDHPTDSSISSYRYQCQSDILQIMSLEMFLQKKVLHAEFIRKGSELSKDIPAKATEDGSHSRPGDILSSMVLTNLIKLYASCEYDNDKYLKGKVLLRPPSFFFFFL